MYTVHFTHTPGYGANDHLFEYFVGAFEARLRPCYPTRSGITRAIRHFTHEARAVSAFDGHFSYRLEDSATTQA